MPANKVSVLMVVNTYAPDDPRVIFSAESLTDLGYQVRLIGAARQRRGQVPAQQTINGVDVHILPVVGNRHPVTWLWAFWYWLRGHAGDEIDVPASQRTGFVSLLFFTMWILRTGLFVRADIIHCHDLSPLPACWLLARLKRARLIYDSHENVPTMYAGRKGRIMTRLERMLIPRVDVVIAAGERLAKVMTERRAKKVVHIGNWKRLDDYVVSADAIESLRKKLDIEDTRIVVSHIGTLDSNRELPPLLAAVADTPDVTLLIGGRGHDEDQIIAAAKASTNILWLGWVDLSDVPAYTFLSDVIYYCRSPQHYGGSYELAPAPNKLYEAFAAGRPLIAVRGVGEIGEILERIPAGILLDEVSPDTIKEAFGQLRDPSKQQVLNAAALQARDQYNWAVAEERLQTIYDDLMA